MVLVDVEKFGDPARTDTDQLQLRRGMYGALKRAFGRAGIPWERCEVGDRGDGAMILVPPDVSKNRLVALLPAPLVDAIEEHNADCLPPARIRLRMALHAGEIHRDEHGQTSDSLNFAFRMLDSDEVKKALRSSSGVLVIIVSGWFHNNVVRHDPAAKPDSYGRVRFQAKETTANAWIRCPDNAVGMVTSSSEHVTRELNIAEDRLTELLRTNSSNSSRHRQSPLTTLVDRLLAIPTVAQEAGRRLLIDHLRPEMANAVPYFSQSRHHVFSLVRTCMNYPGGVEELLSTIHLLEGESTPVRRLDETVADLISRPPE
jgi:hypothetical protein